VDKSDKQKVDLPIDTTEIHMLLEQRKLIIPAQPQLEIVVRTERRFQWWDYPIFAILTALNITAVAVFLFYWFSLGDWWRHPVLFAILTLAVLLNLGMWQSRWLFLPLMRRPRPIAARPGWKVGVATTFVPGAEPLAMLEETVKALVAMDYPHDTWVLDEGDDDAVKELCLQLGAHHFSRKHFPQYQTETGTFEARSKHGNYNAWLHEIGFDRYDIITGFDPDHVPNRDFLTNVLGYFNDPEVGYVQAAQAYYNQEASFIARGAAEETYMYYSSIQMTSYSMGYPIVTGCHNTHRGTALKQVGGFSAHEADDLLITIMYRCAGWKGVYVPSILAKGLTPADWPSYLTQQRRWARSVLDVKFWVYPKVAAKLPLLERLISFVHGLYYLHGLITALQIVLLVFMLVTGVTPAVFSAPLVPRLAFLILTLQLCDFYKQRFFLDFKREWGIHWRGGLVQFAKWPFILLALYDALSPHHKSYMITRKVRAKFQRSMLVIPHMFVIAIISFAWTIGVVTGRMTNPMLHASSLVVIIFSLVTILTAFLRFPDLYDPKLLSVAKARGNL
jgi:cellulose synthase (UDP-forming)